MVSSMAFTVWAIWLTSWMRESWGTRISVSPSWMERMVWVRLPTGSSRLRWRISQHRGMDASSTRVMASSKIWMGLSCSQKLWAGLAYWMNPISRERGREVSS